MTIVIETSIRRYKDSAITILTVIRRQTLAEWWENEGRDLHGKEAS